jgi:RNA polymerase sigma-70 factor (ECF subfamily)
MPINAEAMSKTERFEEIAIVHVDLVYRCALQMTKNESVGLSGDADPEDAIFGCLFDDDVAAAVNSLPIKYRTVVLLADIEGFSYKEIADRVNCPIGTVMSRLSRGRRLLKKRLQDYAVRHGFA